MAKNGIPNVVNKLLKTFKGDGWSNVLNRKNVKGKDPLKGYNIHRNGKLDVQTCNAMYSDQGIPKRIVDLPVEFITKKGFRVKEDTENEYPNIYEDLKLFHPITRFLTYNYKSGGAIALIGLNDGYKDFTKPVKPDRVKSIKFLRIIDRDKVRVFDSDRDNDITSENYGEPIYYTITPENGGVEYKAHYTRVYRGTGILTSDEDRRHHNNLWGDSIYQATYQTISYNESGYHDITSILNDFITTTINVKGLENKIATGREKEITKRVDVMDYTRSLANTVFLDENEKYEKKASSVGGLSEAMRELNSALTLITGAPVALLIGTSPGGMNSSGNVELDFWYSKIEQKQKLDYVPLLDFINYFISISSEYNVQVKDPKVLLLPLKDISAVDLSVVKKNTSEANLNDYRSGAITPAEIRTKYANGEYTPEITLDETNDAIINNNPFEDTENEQA